ncbi:Uncharacterised protein [Vibrio cholerae]|nr:Uncharacterised protein [Vibrio cholerae]
MGHFTVFLWGRDVCRRLELTRLSRFSVGNPLYRMEPHLG